MLKNFICLMEIQKDFKHFLFMDYKVQQKIAQPWENNLINNNMVDYKKLFHSVLLELW